MLIQAIIITTISSELSLVSKKLSFFFFKSGQSYPYFNNFIKAVLLPVKPFLPRANGETVNSWPLTVICSLAWCQGSLTCFIYIIQNVFFLRVSFFRVSLKKRIHFFLDIPSPASLNVQFSVQDFTLQTYLFECCGSSGVTIWARDGHSLHSVNMRRQYWIAMLIYDNMRGILRHARTMNVLNITRLGHG